MAAYRAALQKGTRGLEPATLGEQENRTARLEEAIAAYRAALREWLRGLEPTTPGQRESGAVRLEEAVAAYRAALQEWNRWAQTQMIVGSAFRKLRKARLEEAVAVYRAALQERTREREPFDWAQTQKNLGIALQKLGEQESGTAQLEEAVAAFDACLIAMTVWSRWVLDVRSRRDKTRAEIKRRMAK